MLSCKDVTRTIASEERAEASGWRRFQARLHLLMCNHCRRYAAQLREIGTAARNLWRTRSVDEDPEAVQRLAETILKGADRGSEKK